jgi:hypothetical protein
MIREIHIRPVLNGYIVNVGCQTIVFTDRKTAVGTLSDYLHNPDEVEKHFLANALNKMEPACPQPCAVPTAGTDVAAQAPIAERPRR